MSETTSVVLNILNRNYKVECDEEQMEGLCEAANYLTRSLGLLGVKGAGDRAYLSMALSMAYDYLRTEETRKAYAQRIQGLSNRIDAYLQA